MPATFSVPARRLRSCLPPLKNGRQPDAALHPQRPDAFRAVELVRRHRQQIDAELPDVHRYLARALHGIGVKQRPVSMGDGGELGDRLDRADLVVGVHHRHEGRVVGHGLAQPVGRHDPARVERQEGRFPSALRQRLEGVEHGLVLDARRDEVPAAGNFERFGGAANGEIVGFGAAAGEDDFRRFGANQGRGCAPRVVNCRFCLLPVVMNTRRIAEKILECAHHGVRGGRVDRGRRVVIEIDAHVLIGHVNTRSITSNPKENKG